MRLAGYPLISAGEAFRALIPAAAQGPAADIRLKVSTVRLGSNRRTLTAEFAGAAAGTGPCTADYRLELAESRTAVVVGILEHDHAGGMSCAAVGYPRQPCFSYRWAPVSLSTLSAAPRSR